MSADADAPSLVPDGVVYALVAGVAGRLHGVASERAGGRGTVARADVDRIGRVAEVVDARELARLRSIRVGARRHRQAEPSRREGIGDSLEGDGRVAVGQADHGTHRAAERVAREPDVGIRVELGDVGVELTRGLVVAALLPQRLHDARVVAGVGARRAVAHLVPGPGALLGAAAAEEEVVVDLVVGGRAISVKHGGRCALQPDHDGRVGLVGPHVPTEAVALPAEVDAAVEGLADFFPVRLAGLLYVRVGSHQSEAQDRVLIGHVGSRNVIHGPRVGGQDGDVALLPGEGYHGINHARSAVGQPVYPDRIAPGP